MILWKSPVAVPIHDFRLSTASFDFNYAANPIPTLCSLKRHLMKPLMIHEEAESPRSGRFRGDRPNMANAPSENVTGAAEKRGYLEKYSCTETLWMLMLMLRTVKIVKTARKSRPFWKGIGQP